MEIWQWVYDVQTNLRESGNVPLADAIDNISSYTCNDHHDKVDTLYPQALSLARKEDNPWIELFIRHWHLQSQVLHRHNAKGMLSEAVDLLEFSSRKNTKDCPQSVCVVQDLASCYGKLDGPGFVDERIAVCEETLAKIDPKWPCFECINSEINFALLDAGKYTQVLEAIKQQKQAMLKAGAQSENTSFKLEETQALIALGDYEKAEQTIRQAENPYAGDSFTRYKSALTAITLAYQGHYDEARKYELDFDTVLSAHSHFNYWCELNYHLGTKQPHSNTANLNRQFNLLANRFIDHGCFRDAVKVSHWQAELALARNDLFSVDVCMARINELLPQLNKDLGASNALTALTCRYQQAIEAQIESEDPSLLDLQQQCQQNPQDEDLLVAFVDSLTEHGYGNMAQEASLKFLGKNPDTPELLNSFGHALLSSKALDAFDEYFEKRLTSQQSPSTLLIVNWLLYLRHAPTDEAKALAYLQHIIAQDDTLVNPLQRAAALATKLEDYPLSIDYWTRLIDTSDELINDYHWDRMIPASIIGQWDIVRESCALLDIKLADEQGEIDQDMGRVRIQLTDEDGEHINLYAHRTGPVSATISHMREPHQQQFFDDKVVFDADSLNKLDCEDDEGEKCDSEGYYHYLYPCVKTIHHNDNFYFCIDGVYPGKHSWDILVQQLVSLGPSLSRRSSEDYVLYSDVSPTPLNAIYALIACPADTDFAAINAILQAVSSDFVHPLIWPQLLEKIGDVDGLKQQADIEALYGIE